MSQMSQNDSHFEVSSFEMTQNDSFAGLKCPTEHPLSPADESPATPPFPQNDTPSNTLTAPVATPTSSTPAQLDQGLCPRGILLVASSRLRGPLILSGAKNLTHTRETLSSTQGDSEKTLGKGLRRHALQSLVLY